MAYVHSSKVTIAAIALAIGVGTAFGGCGLSTHGTSESSGQRCTAAAQCEDSNPCTSDACTADGVCTHAPVADGDAPAATQHAGSCQKSVCKAGALAMAPDDTNVSDDGEACTDDLCKDGKPVHPAKSDSTECKIGLAIGRCAGGACKVQCGQGLPKCDDANGCTEDSCDVAVGSCVFTPLDGVTIPGKTDAVGDCRAPRCVGGTEVAAAIDDTDLPTAASDCVTPTCTNGAPSSPSMPTGTACVTAGGSWCDGQGGCVECNVETDCAGLPPSDECTTRVCEAHACKLVFVAKDTKTKNQTVGDCQATVCDGAGNKGSTADDTDLPVDGNDCVEHLCAAGVPKTPPLAAGAKCGVNQAFVCDGLGSCGCLAPTDCSGADDACKTRTCTGKKCGFDYQKAGTVLPDAQQTLGDCQELECDGAGNINSLAKNADLPIDGNECTEDLCTVGAASNPPVALDTGCATGFCDGAGACAECNHGAQCPAPPVCIAATCNAHACGTTPIAAGTLAPPAQQTAADCKDVACDGKGGTSQAPDPNDLPDDGNDCTADTCTAQGVPTFSAKPAHAACAQNGGKVCDGKTSCVGCVDVSDCTAPNTCDGNVCSCTKQTCAQLALTCGTGSDGCGGTVTCNDAKKDGSETDVDCGGAAASCSLRCGLGKLCLADSDCSSGHCADGVCCDKACSGPCEACTKALNAGVTGTCGNIAAGKPSDPSKAACPNATDVCGSGGQCRCGDGAKNGTETDVDCGGGVCGMCATGATCGASGDCASTFCADSVCCATQCNATCVACTSALTGLATGTCNDVTAGLDPHNQCLLGGGGAESCGVGAACQCSDGVKDGTGPAAEADTDCGGSLCPKCAAGKKCSANANCASNFCADGVCCNLACGGPCQACTKALNGGADGTCGNIAPGQPPKAACPKANDVCGTGGLCRCGDGSTDGAETDVDCGGAICAKCGPAKVCGVSGDCANTFCVDGFCCNSACSGVCQACSAAVSVGVNGTCSDVKPGLDPHDTCALGGGAEVCGSAHKCQCSDGAKDGAETDTDCGGPTCNACANGKLCGGAGDCQSGFCGPDTQCHPASCDDKQLGGNETDVDCGGSCQPCANGKNCSVNGDCISNSCPGGNTCK